MKLVITEKPSVAKSISAVLGADKRRDGYCEGGNFLVSWCFGHLAELASAEVYDEAYAKWSREQLPIIPESWQPVPVIFPISARPFLITKQRFASATRSMAPVIAITALLFLAKALTNSIA